MTNDTGASRDYSRATCFVLLWLVLSSSVFGRELLTFDGSLKDQFTPLSKSRLEAWKPNETQAESGDPRPQGRALRLTAPAGGGFVTNPEVINVDWPKIESLGLWLHRTVAEAKEHPAVELELRLIEEDRTAYFWRRVDVAHVGWQKLLLPLDWFVWSEGRIPRWDKVRFIGFRLRDEGEVTVDTMWSEEAPTSRDSFTPADLVARLAFPGMGQLSNLPTTPGQVEKTSHEVRTLETRHVQLVTNAKSLEMERLAAHCGAIATQVRRELPFLAEPARGPLLIVFQTGAEYRGFVPRHARRLNVLVQPPESSGFTLQGVSSSSWDAEYGSLRPVFTHEFLHGYLCRASRFPCHGEWLHEGLATYFQLQFHPQANLDDVIAEGLTSAKGQVPLNELCNGRRILLGQYWQAGTLWQMLLSEKRYQSNLATLFERLEAASSTDLGPHLQPVWETNWDKLTTDWRAFCNQRSAKRPKPS